MVRLVGVVGRGSVGEVRKMGDGGGLMETVDRGLVCIEITSRMH